ARGNDLAWGVRTSARHVFDSKALFKQHKLGGDVWFEAPPGELSVNFQPQAMAQTISLLDATGAPLAEFALVKEPVVYPIPPSPKRRLLGLRIQKKQLDYRIDGVTHFKGNASQGPFPNSNFWASRADGWFNIRRIRHSLFPRRRHLFRLPGTPFRAVFTVRNPDAAPAGFLVSAESAGLQGIRLEPVGGTVRLAAGEMRSFALSGTLPPTVRPGASLAARLRVSRAETPALTVYATLTVTAGIAPATRNLDMPLVLKPYAHANALLGYEPEYVPNAPYFDLQNRPTIRWRGYHRHLSDAVEILDMDGTWRHAEFMSALKAALPGFGGLYFPTFSMGVKTAFDRGGACTLVSAYTKEGRRSVLLDTIDDFHSYQVIPFGPVGKVGFEIEQFTGHNTETDHPAPILLSVRTRDHKDHWASYNDLFLYLPERGAGGKIDMGEPIKVSSRCIGFAPHSGGASAIASRRDKVHLVWGETVEKREGVPGVPTYVATYDRSTKTLGKPILVAHGPPVNDVHNSPGIVLDHEGRLHVVTGAHGAPFYHTSSLAVNDAYSGWSTPVPVLSSGRKYEGTDEDGKGEQTYLGLVCTPDGTLHIVSRQWRIGVDSYHPGRLYAALAYQRKRAGKPWEEARPLVVPPLSDYSVWYHKLCVDRRGRLFVDHVYYSVHPTYNNDVPGRLDYPALMMSPDGGDSWKLVQTTDFLQAMEQ
ncbi:MAG: BNR-4 repeat-containing protein, partial [Lentisphaeria bacterium]|nr:BNR-4 repeat-containing protein [Lentisphaeria bacterium]